MHKKRNIDCADCFIVKDKIVDSGVNGADYGSKEDTKILKKCRIDNKVSCSKAHEEAAFGRHAAGILADFYVTDTLRNNLGPPPPILDFTIACALEESIALGSGYNISYFLCIY